MIYSWYQAHWQALLLLQAALGTWVFAYGLKRRPHFIRRAVFSLAAGPSGGGSYTAFVAFQRVDTAFDDFAHIRIADSGRLSLF